MMCLHAHGRPRSHHRSTHLDVDFAIYGFTLIEILVVLVVLGIAASIVVFQLAGDDRRDVQREAKRLAGALEHAAAVAQWSGETLGVSAEGGVYRFWRRGTNDSSSCWAVTKCSRLARCRRD